MSARVGGEEDDVERSHRTGLALVALAAVALVTLGPRWLVAPARNLFTQVMDAAVPAFAGGLPYADERALNLVLFVPLGATLALLLARRLWPLAVLAGAFVSIAVELAQTAIPGRVPDPHDVLWNSLGAAAGAVAVAGVRGIAAASRRASVASPPGR